MRPSPTVATALVLACLICVCLGAPIAPVNAALDGPAQPNVPLQQEQQARKLSSDTEMMDVGGLRRCTTPKTRLQPLMAAIISLFSHHTLLI